ncbi:MAG: hypothetical protein K5675_11040 [Lachnospiraceae bacterium]|nr:hypothetical protein [Lachnospiraceae bacterium]
MIEDFSKIVEEKVNEAYEICVREYTKEHPSAPVDEDIKHAVKERATSHLMFAMSTLTFPENVDQKAKIEDWYTEEVKRDVIDVSKRCMKEELEKKASAGGDGLSDIERYLRKHGMGLDR